MSPDAQRSRTSNDSGHLDIAIRATGEEATVTLAGELDFAAAPEVTSSLERLSGESRAIVLDIEAVTFIDSAGLRCILVCEGLCRDGGVKLRMSPHEVALDGGFEQRPTAEASRSSRPGACRSADTSDPARDDYVRIARRLSSRRSRVPVAREQPEENPTRGRRRRRPCHWRLG